MRRVLALGVLSSLGAIAFAPACDEPRSHIFIGRVYDPLHGCVDPSEAIDVVDGTGPDPGPCPVVCIIDQEGDVAITGMCPPYPGEDTVEQQGVDGGLDSVCTLAMAIYNCNVTCDADAGPDGGLPITDAASCLPGAESGMPSEAGAGDAQETSTPVEAGGPEASTDGAKTD
jgi:hypothetical protein